jgi:NADP-dependent 3-hydroxy acid dehydrogenase YdfG
VDLALKDRVAVIGGSSAGIGLAIAELFASEGAAVTIVARRKEPLESAGSLRAKTGARAAVPADIRRADDAPASSSPPRPSSGASMCWSTTAHRHRPAR